MPKFGEEDSYKKKSNKVNAGGYNIDAGYEDSDESDLENTVPDEENDWERDYSLPAYGPEFIEKDYDYGFKNDKNTDKRGGAPKSPMKKSSSKNSNSPVREPTSNNTINIYSSNNTTPTKSYSNSNSRLYNNSSNLRSGSDTTAPVNNTNNINSNYSYTNHMPATLVQTTLERTRTNSGDLGPQVQAANNNNSNATNIVHLDSSPANKTHTGHQQVVPATHTSPVAPVQQYTGPKIKIYLNILVLGKKTVITYPTEDNNGVPVSTNNIITSH